MGHDHYLAGMSDGEEYMGLGGSLELHRNRSFTFSYAREFLLDSHR